MEVVARLSGKKYSISVNTKKIKTFEVIFGAQWSVYSSLFYVC